MQIASDSIEEFKALKLPKHLSYEGRKELLTSVKVSIVGTRRPSKYAREMTTTLAQTLSKRGFVIVSGGAMGIDAVAHQGAKSDATIAVLPCGITQRYPAVNKNLLNSIAQEGLLLSQFEDDFRATPWSFVLRNELVVALGEILIVSEADLGGGSMRSVEYAHKQGKEIYVLAHRIGQSSGTNSLLQENKAKAIYDIESFCNTLAQRFGLKQKQQNTTIEDPFLALCKTNPSYEELIQKFPQRVFEAELNGEIRIENARVYLEN